MADRSNQDSEYYVIREKKSKPKVRYVYYDDDGDDDDDDNDNDEDFHKVYTSPTSKKLVRKKQVKQPKVRYITTDEFEANRRRHRKVEPHGRQLRLRHTTKGDQILLDEDDNIIKVIRDSRTPSPPVVELRRKGAVPRENQVVYYETPDGRLTERTQKPVVITKKQSEIMYSEEEPTRIVRQIIVDPKTTDQEVIYESEQTEKPRPQRYVMQKRMIEVPTVLENQSEQQLLQHQQYVQVVQQETVPTQVVKSQDFGTKYVMIRRKVEPEQAFTNLPTSVPKIKTNRHIAYETPTKKPQTRYVYVTNEKSNKSTNAS